MPQTVTDQNGAVHEFPDEATPAMIAEALGVRAPLAIGRHPAPEQQGMLSDIGSGVARGLANIPGLTLGIPGDLQHLVELGARRAFGWLGTKVGTISPEDYQKLIDSPTDATLPGSETLIGLTDSALKNADINVPQPQTAVGKFAQTGTELLPALLGGEASLLSKVARRIALPAAAGEGAGQATEGTALEPYARAAGTLVGGGIGALGERRNMIGRVLADAAPNVTQQDLLAAQALMADAARMGTPLTLPEALQHVTGGGTSLDNLQRVVEASRGGSPIMKDFMAGRPEGNAGAANAALDAIMPPSANPSQIGPRVNRAAERTLQDARDETNALSKPAYDATSNNPAALLSDPSMQWLQGNAAISDALKAVRGNPIEYGDLRGLSDNSLMVLDQVKKYLNDVQSGAKDAGRNFAASNAGSAAERLTYAMDREFPRYASARNIQSMRQTHVEEPLALSPTGQLANTENIGQQGNILFKPNPPPGSEQEIAKAITDIAAKDPEAARHMVSDYLRAQFNEANQRLQSGPNQAGGAKFAAMIRGNEQQSKNLEAALSALPGGRQNYESLNRVLDVFEAQGRRQPIGSQTAFNQEAMDLLKRGDLVGAVTTIGASPGKWPGFVRQQYEQFRLGRNTETLATLFTSPDAVRQFRRLTRLPSGSPEAAEIVGRLILQANAGAEPARPPEQAAK